MNCRKGSANKNRGIASIIIPVVPCRTIHPLVRDRSAGWTSRSMFRSAPAGLRTRPRSDNVHLRPGTTRLVRTTHVRSMAAWFTGCAVSRTDAATYARHQTSKRRRPTTVCGLHQAVPDRAIGPLADGWIDHREFAVKGGSTKPGPYHRRCRLGAKRKARRTNGIPVRTAHSSRETFGCRRPRRPVVAGRPCGLTTEDGLPGPCGS